MIEDQDLQFRLYGQPPHSIAVIHGGPGAAGEMAPVAQRLSQHHGIIEPLQTATSINGQIQELKLTLQQHAAPPTILIGYSWGAWLSILLTAQYPTLVKKLILISSGPFQSSDAHSTDKTRRSRFTPDQQKEFDHLINQLQNPKLDNQSQLLSQLGALCATADCHTPIQNQTNDSPPPTINATIFQKVWPEAAQFRKSGFLLDQLKKITCPITAIHGDYDPHPPSGVKHPLAKIHPTSSFILLPNCGHKPWIEHHAQEAFYNTLNRELPSTKISSQNEGTAQNVEKNVNV
jgi:pimeloyl-ACP methyl ester carboxylesterase